MEVLGLQDGSLIVFQDREQVLIGDEDLGVGILHHEEQALRGVGGIQRQIGAAGLERTQRRGHHVLVAAQHDAYHAAGRYVGFQVHSQGVG